MAAQTLIRRGKAPTFLQTCRTQEIRARAELNTLLKHPGPLDSGALYDAARALVYWSDLRDQEERACGRRGRAIAQFHRTFGVRS